MNKKLSSEGLIYINPMNLNDKYAIAHLENKLREQENL